LAEIAANLQRRGARERAGSAASGRGLARLLVLLFMIGVLLPVILNLGLLRLSVYRVLLLVIFFPSVFLWLRGEAGRVRLADFCLLITCFWAALSLTVNHGLSRSLEPSGIFFIETMGTYLLARLTIRGPDDFRNFVRILFWIVVLLLPFALVEALSGKAVIIETFRKFAKTFSVPNQEARLGLHRVQGPFEHPILFGTFCGGALGMTWYVLGYGRSIVLRLGALTAVAGTAFLSLSSGPITSLGAQFGLLVYDTILRRWGARWKFLAGTFLAFIIAIEIAANRSAAQILISIVALNGSTAYNRLRIWQFGSASALKHPLFGVGYNEWERPAWMLPSIDMFWLVPAVKFGLLPAIMMQVAFFSVLLAVIFRKGLPKDVASYRTGYVISMLGLYATGWTVHFWNSVYVLFIFLIGAGFWFLTYEAEPSGAAPADTTRQDAVRARRRAGGPSRKVETVTLQP
jgi:hypothetical protein